MSHQSSKKSHTSVLYDQYSATVWDPHLCKNRDAFEMVQRRAAMNVNKSSAVAEMSDRGYNRHGPKIGGGLLCPFRESWDPVSYNVAWAGEVYFRTKRPLHSSSHLATIGMGQKLGGVGVPFFGGSWVHIEHNVAYAELYL